MGFTNSVKWQGLDFYYLCYYPVIIVLARSWPILIKNPESIQSKTGTRPGENASKSNMRQQTTTTTEWNHSNNSLVWLLCSLEEIYRNSILTPKLQALWWSIIWALSAPIRNIQRDCLMWTKYPWYLLPALGRKKKKNFLIPLQRDAKGSSRIFCLLQMGG